MLDPRYWMLDARYWMTLVKIYILHLASSIKYLEMNQFPLYLNNLSKLHIFDEIDCFVQF